MVVLYLGDGRETYVPLRGLGGVTVRRLGYR